MKLDSVKLAGLLSFLGAAQFVVFLMVAEAVQPDYSIRDNFISDLGVGPSAPIFNSSVFVLGLFVLIAAVFLYRGRRIKVLPIVLVLVEGACRNVVEVDLPRASSFPGVVASY